MLLLGMYIENTLRVAQEELLWETDYLREADAQLVSYLNA